MAALRMAFQDWLEGEPEEPDTDNPSEEQMHQFEEAEKAQEVLVSISRFLKSATLSPVSLLSHVLFFLSPDIIRYCIYLFGTIYKCPFNNNAHY